MCENRIGRLDFTAVELTIDEVAKSKSGRERFEKFSFLLDKIRKMAF